MATNLQDTLNAIEITDILQRIGCHIIDENFVVWNVLEMHFSHGYTQVICQSAAKDADGFYLTREFFVDKDKLGVLFTEDGIQGKLYTGFIDNCICLNKQVE